MQSQIAEIGARYLRRTLGELPLMHEMVERLADDPEQADLMLEIERMAHKIYGSGAMFGFDMVSGRAREVELLAAEHASDAATIGQLRERVAALASEVSAAAHTRGIP